MSGLVEELPSGVRVYQATDEEADKSNIYCEFPWCPPDSHCFVYTRYAPEHAPNTSEYVACEFGTWEKRLVGHGAGGCTMSRGRFYYKRVEARGRQEFVRHDLQSWETKIIPLPAGVPASSSLAISPDERYLAFARSLGFAPQRFGIGIADLQAGECRIIHEDPYVCNPHLQFEPVHGRSLLVQHNRGCVFAADGRLELLCGKEGCTLFLLSVPDGQVTRLQVGPPYTASLSGHETWLGASGGLIATLNYTEDYDYGKGRVVTVFPGQPAREVCVPWELNHIGIEPAGRVFAGDAYRPDEIVIGSPLTHRAAVVCASGASYARACRRTGRPDLVHDSHPHAYISPDCQWVVFNSDRTGIQQIYAARIPAAMIDALTRT